MPLPVDPNETFILVLDSDKAKPESAQVKFRFRYLTGRELVKVSEITDMTTEDLNKLSVAELVQRLYDSLKINLVDIENSPIPDAGPEDLTTTTEAWQLLYRARRQSKLSVAEKNASASPSDSPGDASAEAASPASAPTP